MGALGDGVDPHLDDRLHLCNLIGLNPEETTEIRVRIDPGAGAVIEWTGRRRVSLTKLTEGLAAALDDDLAADSEKWSIGPDPWAEPPC